MKIVMLSPNLPPRPCGVGDFVHRLARELDARGLAPMLMAFDGGEGTSKAGLKVVRIPGVPWHPGRANRVAKQVADAGTELLNYHYVPFSYGRKGLSLGAALFPALVRRRGTAVVTTLHELAMPWGRKPRGVAVAAAHRLQLALLMAGSDAVIVTTAHRKAKLRKWFPWQASMVYQVPIGATVEVARYGTSESASEVPVGSSMVVGFFGTPHPSKRPALVAQCLVDLVRAGVDAKLLWIGIEGTDLKGILHGFPDVETVLDRSVCTGWVPVDSVRISELLSAIDILPLPLVDGVSTLRTSVISALAHGLAIVGTRGRETDATLSADGGLLLVPAGDDRGFRQAVLSVARDEHVRASLRMKARELYERLFSWPKLAEATLAVYRACCHLEKLEAANA